MRKIIQDSLRVEREEKAERLRREREERDRQSNDSGEEESEDSSSEEVTNKPKKTKSSRASQQTQGKSRTRSNSSKMPAPKKLKMSSTRNNFDLIPSKLSKSALLDQYCKYHIESAKCGFRFR